MNTATDAPVTSDPPRGRPSQAFPGLNAVRAIGATAVVATHVAFETGRSVRGPLSGTLARFDMGVALFFVLSGFLLFRPYALAASSDRNRWPSTRSYLIRRGLRILPAYWLAVAACLILIPSNAGARGPSVWLRHLTLTQIYSRGEQRYGLTQTWSLCTEVAFYLLLPLLARVVLGRRGGAAGSRPWLALLFLCSISMAWQLLFTQTSLIEQSVAGQWLPGYLDWFAGGMALALVQVRLSHGRPFPWMTQLAELARSWGACWIAALAVFALATSPVAGPRSLEASATSWEAITKNLLYATVGVLLVLPLVLGDQGGGAAKALGSRAMRLLGEISYGIFLWHLLVLETLVRMTGRRLFQGSWVVLFVEAWTLSVVAATLSYVFVERPALRLKDRLVGRDSGRRGTGSTREDTSTRATIHST